MTGDTCTHGVRDPESATRYHYDDYTDECGRPATGTSALGGHPRCDEHRAWRYVVAVGTSLTLTKGLHYDPESAKREVLSRLGHYTDPLHGELERKLSRCSARPARDADVTLFGALATQDKRWTRKTIREHLGSQSCRRPVRPVRPVRAGLGPADPGVLLDRDRPVDHRADRAVVPMSAAGDRVLAQIDAMTDEQRKVALQFLSGYDLSATSAAVRHALRTEPTEASEGDGS